MLAVEVSALLVKLYNAQLTAPSGLYFKYFVLRQHLLIKMSERRSSIARLLPCVCFGSPDATEAFQEIHKVRETMVIFQ